MRGLAAVLAAMLASTGCARCSGEQAEQEGWSPSRPSTGASRASTAPKNLRVPTLRALHEVDAAAIDSGAASP